MRVSKSACVGHRFNVPLSFTGRGNSTDKKCCSAEKIKKISQVSSLISAEAESMTAQGFDFFLCKDWMLFFSSNVLLP